MKFTLSCPKDRLEARAAAAGITDVPPDAVLEVPDFGTLAVPAPRAGV